MKRRSFLRRITKASVAFVAAPGIFRALPAGDRLKQVVGTTAAITDEAARKAFVNSFFFGKPFDEGEILSNWTDTNDVVTFVGLGDGGLAQITSWKNSKIS